MLAKSLSRLSLVVVLALTLAAALPAHHGAAAQTVRDHRARLCRVAYDALPRFQGNPLTITTCHLADNNVQVIGSVCTCTVLIEGHFVIVPGTIVHA
jgi:hypothetical protein